MTTDAPGTGSPGREQGTQFDAVLQERGLKREVQHFDSHRNPGRLGPGGIENEFPLVNSGSLVLRNPNGNPELTGGSLGDISDGVAGGANVRGRAA